MNGEVTDAAIAWWESIRPVRYTLEEHLKSPEVNANSDAERRLATAVAEYIMASIRLQKYMENQHQTELGK